jgi:uncharacterized membrane protein YtjA (UPF0391 family)
LEAAMLTWAMTFLILAIVAGVLAFLTVGPVAPMLLVVFMVFFIGALAWHLWQRHNPPPR